MCYRTSDERSSVSSSLFKSVNKIIGHFFSFFCSLCLCVSDKQKISMVSTTIMGGKGRKGYAYGYGF